MSADPYQDTDDVEVEVLIEDEALSYVGPWARGGRLRLTPTELTHTPSGTLDKMVGAEEIVLPIDAIDGADLSGLDRMLLVRAGEKTWRFGGAGARRVCARLLALLDERDGTTDPGSRFVSGERVLLHGAMDLYRAGPLGTRGHLSLTDLRLRFEAGPGLERLLWNDVGFNILIDQIRGVSLRGVRQHLLVHTDDGLSELGGTLGPRFYRELVGRVGDPTETDTSEPTGGDTDGDSDGDSERQGGAVRPLASWEASVRSGALVFAGDLVVEKNALRFVPASGLGPAMGAEPIALPLLDIHRLRLHDGPDPRIIIRARAAKLTVMLPDARKRFDDLIHLLHQALHLRAIDEPTAMLQSIKTEWGTRQGWAELPIVCSDPALERLGEGDWRVGLILTTVDRVYFAPNSPPKPETLDHNFSLRSLVRQQAGSPELVDQVRFQADGQKVTWWPVSGRPFVRKFWKNTKPLARVVGWDEAGVGTHSRLEGPVHFIRAHIDGRVAVDARPARGILRVDGWGAVLPGPSADRLARAPLIDFEVGQPEGVYRFEVHPVGVIIVPAEHRDDMPKGGRLLLTSFPKVLRVYNRRSRFRVPLGLAAMASSPRLDRSGRAMGDTDFRVHVEDLSTRGLGVRSPLRLQVGARITLHLMIDGHELELDGHVLREDAAIEGGADRRYGIRLAALPDGQGELLHRIIMHRQRELLTARAVRLSKTD